MYGACMESGRCGVTDELNEEILRFVRLLKMSASTPGGPDMSALLLLWPLAQKPMRVRALAQAKGSDPSTVSRQADQLVRDGLISREPDPSDARARMLVLTEKGRAICD